MGWLTIQIGAFEGVLENGKNCDLGFGNAVYCDPYVQIVINDKKEFTTSAKKNVQRWTTFDETYRSKKMSKNTKITIKVKHDAITKKGKKLLEQTLDIDSLVKKTRIDGPHSILFLNSLWQDEFI